jgi:hypothetical protein
LFESAFANGHTTSLSHFTVAGPSTVASPSAEPGPSNRPDVSYTPRERTRAWTRQDSPSSSRSSGSTSSRSRSHPRSSLRSPASNISQLDFVSKLVDGAKSSGSPALPALERTRNQWLRANESRPGKQHCCLSLTAVTKVDLSKPLKALQLDTRKPLDEAVARVEHKVTAAAGHMTYIQFEPPRTLIKPRPAPKPFEMLVLSVDSH